MAVAFVQSHSSAENSTATTISGSFAAAVSNGNAVCGIVSWGTASSSDFNSVTDDKGNTYNRDKIDSDGPFQQGLGLFWLNNITNAPLTITTSFGGKSVTDRAHGFHEVSGVDRGATPTDGSTGQLQSALSTATDAVTSGDVVTGANGDYIFVGTARTDLTANNVFAAGTNYTRRETTGSGVLLNIATEDRIQPNAATTAGTFTSSATNINAVTLFLALKAAAAAGGTVRHPWLTLLGVG